MGTHWKESVARFVVGGWISADVAPACLASEVGERVDELGSVRAEFEAMWGDNEVLGHGDGVKALVHPKLGPIELEYSAILRQWPT